MPAFNKVLSQPLNSGELGVEIYVSGDVTDEEERFLTDQLSGFSSRPYTFSWEPAIRGSFFKSFEFIINKSSVKNWVFSILTSIVDGRAANIRAVLDVLDRNDHVVIKVGRVFGVKVTVNGQKYTVIEEVSSELAKDLALDYELTKKPFELIERLKGPDWKRQIDATRGAISLI